MLRSIAGLETPDVGHISIGDTVVFDSERMIDLASEKRQIGMVFQSYAVWPHMTVGENVGFPLKIRRVPAKEIEARVNDVLSLVGLGGLAGRPSTNLSGGQQQRVALARAIVHEPRLVLFDEPLSNLDAKLRHQMRTELKLLQDRLGFTAIYVTHDQQEALALSDTVIVMNYGRVEAMASPRELFTHPRTPFVANFLGFDNMFEGEVAWIGDAAGTNPAPKNGAVQPIGVTIGGIGLRCFWRGNAPPSCGTPVTLAFRGDRVSLRPAGEPDDSDTNQCDGTVEARVYVGTYQDYVIEDGILARARDRTRRHVDRARWTGHFEHSAGGLHRLRPRPNSGIGRASRSKNMRLKNIATGGCHGEVDHKIDGGAGVRYCLRRCCMRPVNHRRCKRLMRRTRSRYAQ